MSVKIAGGTADKMGDTTMPDKYITINLTKLKRDWRNSFDLPSGKVDVKDAMKVITSLSWLIKGICDGKYTKKVSK